MSDCCLKGFQWDGTPQGRVSKLGATDTYVTGDNTSTAIIIIHDLYGWTFRNTRLLADHYAREVNATVFVPDFYGGEQLDSSIISQSDRRDWAKLNLPAFMKRNSKDVRGPEIINCGKALRASYNKVGAVGFCWGGWGVFHLGAKEHDGLVDCVVAAHPSFLEKTEIDSVAVPVQILAPEHDDMFNPDLKEYANKTIPSLGVAYDYQYFPGISHGFAIRGSTDFDGEREGLQRAKDAAVLWFRQWLHD